MLFDETGFQSVLDRLKVVASKLFRARGENVTDIEIISSEEPALHVSIERAARRPIKRTRKNAPCYYSEGALCIAPPNEVRTTLMRPAQGKLVRPFWRSHDYAPTSPGSANEMTGNPLIPCFAEVCFSVQPQTFARLPHQIAFLPGLWPQIINANHHLADPSRGLEAKSTISL